MGITSKTLQESEIWRCIILIFVTVGGRPYPFDRLFKKLDELVENGTIQEEIFAQIGTSNYKPKNYPFTDFVSQEEFSDKINEADIVISHGASGSIMKALNAEKKVIAVTRLEKYGEHIDDHQIQINEAFGENEYVIPVLDLDQLGDGYLKLINNQVKLKKWKNEDKLAVVNLIDEFIIQNWN